MDKLVIRRTLPPLMSATYTCGAPARGEIKAIFRPSGENRGVLSVLLPAISSFDGPDPSAGTIQMSALRSPDFTFVVVRTKLTREPSGDNCGSLTRTAASRSSIVIGRRP